MNGEPFADVMGEDSRKQAERKFACKSTIEFLLKNRRILRFNDIARRAPLGREAVAQALRELIHEDKVERLVPIGIDGNRCPVGSAAEHKWVFYRSVNEIDRASTDYQRSSGSTWSKPVRHNGVRK